ncbi:MAG: FG-GAP-like repeat-containing protein [Pseudomonadota bacterium]
MRAMLLIALLVGCPGRFDSPSDSPPADSEPTTDDTADSGGDPLPAEDVDGDGFFAPEDCNDLDPLIHPDALDVINGADDNCDGARDVQLLSGVHTKLVGEHDGDWAGASVAGLGDVNADGFADIGVGAWYEPTNGRNAGAAYVLLGPVERGTYSLVYSDVKFVGEAMGDTLSRLEGAGDMDGDGVGDLLLCAQYEDTAGRDAGAAYLVLGPPEGPWDLADAEAKILAEAAGDGLMRAMRGGDLDADGFPDLLIGCPGDDTAGSGAGAAYVLTGPISGALSLADAHAKLIGQAGGDTSGAFLAAPGDMDGDGHDDVVVGDHNGSHGGSHRGSAYLIRGPVPAGAGTLLDTASAVFYGSVDDAQAGKVAEAGDLDGDGDTDWLTAAFGDHGARTYLFDGALNGEIAGRDAFAVVALEVADAVGVGDLDADGYDDLLVGDELGSYLLFGPLLGGDLAEADVDVFLPAEEEDDDAGFRVAAAGDTDADGCADLLIGARHEDMGGDDAGAAYLVLGSPRAAR